MRSIEAALAADFYRRGAASIPLTLFGMIALPLWLISLIFTFPAIRTINELDPNSKEAIILHVTLVLVMGFGAAIAVIQAQGQIARFFTRPISVVRLVAIQMALGMSAIAAMYIVAATLINLRGAGWPVIGPALFLATTLACAMAAIWSLEGSVIGQLIGCTGTSVPLSIWFSRRYGAILFGDWKAMWSEPSMPEVGTLLAISAAAYCCAVLGVSRARRGDGWNFAWLKAWWENLLSMRGQIAAFRSSWAAQRWYESQHKLTLAPACLVGFIMLMLLSLWGVGYIETNSLLELQLVVPQFALITILPFMFGLIFGNCGRSSSATQIRFFLATRPVTDRFLASTMLRNCTLALCYAWWVWFVVNAFVLSSQFFLGGNDGNWELVQAHYPQKSITFLFLGLSVLFSWTFTSLMMALVATGRRWLWVSLLIGSISLLLVSFFLKESLPVRWFVFYNEVWIAIVGAICLGGTAWTFVMAHRHRLQSIATILLLFAAWFLGSCAVTTIIGDNQHSPPEFLEIWFFSGLLILSILPFAALPLAIRWNRHR